MSYTIEVHREDGVFVSQFGEAVMDHNEFEQYVQEIIELNMQFAEAGFTQVYHILDLGHGHRQFDFAGLFTTLSKVRQNKTMVDLRNRLHSLSILVTNSSVTTKLIESMLSNTAYGGRRLAIFPTLEKAFEFVEFDKANPTASTEDES